MFILIAAACSFENFSLYKRFVAAPSESAMIIRISKRVNLMIDVWDAPTYTKQRPVTRFVICMFIFMDNGMYITYIKWIASQMFSTTILFPGIIVNTILTQSKWFCVSFIHPTDMHYVHLCQINTLRFLMSTAGYALLFLTLMYSLSFRVSSKHIFLIYCELFLAYAKLHICHFMPVYGTLGCYATQDAFANRFVGWWKWEKRIHQYHQ